MKAFIHSSFVPILLAAAVACSESPKAPTSPSAGTASLTPTAEQLAGTWDLVSIQPAGQAEQPKPAGATYSLTFADGRLSTHADCNMCAAGFAVTGSTLTVGLIACTRAACPTMTFETAYVGILSGDSTAAFNGGVLILSSPRGTLRFSR